MILSPGHHRTLRTICICVVKLTFINSYFAYLHMVFALLHVPSYVYCTSTIRFAAAAAILVVLSTIVCRRVPTEPEAATGSPVVPRLSDASHSLGTAVPGHHLRHQTGARQLNWANRCESLVACFAPKVVFLSLMLIKLYLS